MMPPSGYILISDNPLVVPVLVALLQHFQTNISQPKVSPGNLPARLYFF